MNMSLNGAVPPFQDTLLPQNANQFCSFTSSDIVNVLVGKKRTVFKSHRHVLMKKSPFFHKCLTSGMIEEHTNEVILPEDSCRAFEIVAEWVYSAGTGVRVDDDNLITVMRAWILADKFCMPDLQNVLIDELGSYWAKLWIDPDCLSWVADHTDEASPLYRCAMDQMAFCLKNMEPIYGGSAFPFSDDWDHQRRMAVENRIRDISESLERVLARPVLSTKLLWKAMNEPSDGKAPRESPETYHVPTNSQTGGTTSTKAAKRKRGADDKIEESEVVSNVARQLRLTCKTGRGAAHSAR